MHADYPQASQLVINVAGPTASPSLVSGLLSATVNSTSQFAAFDTLLVKAPPGSYNVFFTALDHAVCSGDHLVSSAKLADAATMHKS